MATGQCAIGVFSITGDGVTILQNSSGPNGRRIIVRTFGLQNSPCVFISSNANEDVDYINVVTDSPLVTILSVTGIRNVNSDISRIAGTEPLSAMAIVTLQASGDVGHLNVTAINQTDIAGDVFGDLVLLEREGGIPSPVIDMEVGGDLLGDVICEFGGIERLIVAGKIGVSSSTRSLIQTSEPIEELVAGEIFADIDCTVFGVDENIVHLSTTGAVGNGDVVGSIVANGLLLSGANPGIFVAGDLDADIEFTSSLGAGRRIVVGGSFADGRTIELPASGLLGQITFNNADSAGDWDGLVVVGSNVLSFAGYPTTAATLGGGSVGLSPFALHDESCDPVSGGNVDALSDDPFNARHYGPVDFTGSGDPVLVERRVIGTSTWTDQTAGFTFSVTGDGAWFLTGTPVSGYAYQNGYEYRITPVRTGSDKLFCDGVSGEPAVAEYTYTHIHRGHGVRL